MASADDERKKQLDFGRKQQNKDKVSSNYSSSEDVLKGIHDECFNKMSGMLLRVVETKFGKESVDGEFKTLIFDIVNGKKKELLGETTGCFEIKFTGYKYTFKIGDRRKKNGK